MQKKIWQIKTNVCNNTWIQIYADRKLRVVSEVFQVESPTWTPSGIPSLPRRQPVCSEFCKHWSWRTCTGWEDYLFVRLQRCGRVRCSCWLIARWHAGKRQAAGHICQSRPLGVHGGRRLVLRPSGRQGCFFVSIYCSFLPLTKRYITRNEGWN